MISFTYQAPKAGYNIDEIAIKKWIKNTIIAEGKKVGDIQYILCNDSQLHMINKRFLNHNTFTDIITFPSTEYKGIISGDIYISLDRVIENSTEHNTTFVDELNRVMVHGVLHLLGYKDSTPSEKKQMRSKEDYYLHLQT